MTTRRREAAYNRAASLAPQDQHVAERLAGFKRKLADAAAIESATDDAGWRLRPRTLRRRRRPIGRAGTFETNLMCGIGGLIGAQDEGGTISCRLLAALRHRGPDDEGMIQPTPTVSLVHTRLSIFDLTPVGHQPMTDGPSRDSSGSWVVFNGEIYNSQGI